MSHSITNSKKLGFVGASLLLSIFMIEGAQACRNFIVASASHTVKAVAESKSLSEATSVCLKKGGEPIQSRTQCEFKSYLGSKGAWQCTARVMCDRIFVKIIPRY